MADATQRSFGARPPLVSGGAVTTSLVRGGGFRAAGAGAAVAQHGAILLLDEAEVRVLDRLRVAAGERVAGEPVPLLPPLRFRAVRHRGHARSSAGTRSTLRGA